jgi:hypothetical protein
MGPAGPGRDCRAHRDRSPRRGGQVPRQMDESLLPGWLGKSRQACWFDAQSEPDQQDQATEDTDKNQRSLHRYTSISRHGRHAWLRDAAADRCRIPTTSSQGTSGN